MANQLPILVDEVLHFAHDEQISKRKLSLILRLHIYENKDFNPGDMVQMFITDGKNKRVKWISPRRIISIDTETGTVKVPSRSSKSVCAAVDDDLAATHEK